MNKYNNITNQNKVAYIIILIQLSILIVINVIKNAQ